MAMRGGKKRAAFEYSGSCLGKEKGKVPILRREEKRPFAQMSLIPYGKGGKKGGRGGDACNIGKRERSRPHRTFLSVPGKGGKMQ